MSWNQMELQPYARVVRQKPAAPSWECVSWILPLVWDAHVTEKSARNPQRFWKKMSQLAQFGLSDGGEPLLHRSPFEMIR
jgi:hypothetical protein